MKYHLAGMGAPSDQTSPCKKGSPSLQRDPTKKGFHRCIKHHSREKCPPPTIILTISPQGRGPLAPPEGTAAIGCAGGSSHPSLATPGTVVCRGGLAFPTTSQWSSRVGGHCAPQEQPAGSCGCPQALFAAGRAQRRHPHHPAWLREQGRRWAARIRAQPGAAQRCREFHSLSPAQADGTWIPLQAQGPRRWGTGVCRTPAPQGK